LGSSPKNETSDIERRLKPEMASFRLLVLGFVRDYIERHHVSPSQGEIRNALETTRSRVRDALRSLEGDGLIHRRPGQRGLSLPSMREDAIRLLREEGFRVDEDLKTLAPPADPHSTLLPAPELDYPANGVPQSQSGDEFGKNGTQARARAQCTT